MCGPIWLADRHHGAEQRAGNTDVPRHEDPGQRDLAEFGGLQQRIDLLERFGGSGVGQQELHCGTEFGSSRRRNLNRWIAAREQGEVLGGGHALAVNSKCPSTGGRPAGRDQWEETPSSLNPADSKKH